MITREKDNRKKRDYANILCESFLVMAILLMLVFMHMSNRYWKEECETPFVSVSADEMEWFRVYADGVREPITLPCEFNDAVPGEMIALESIIPDTVTDKDYFSTLADKQNMRILVDGQIRFSFEQTSEYFVSDQVSSRYVYAPVSTADAGSVIRIEASTPYDTVRKFDVVYYGEKLAVELHYLSSQAVPLVLGIVFVVIGFLCVIAGIILRRLSKGAVRVDYIGWVLALVAMWDLTLSDFSDFLFANVIAIRLIPSMVLLLAPIGLALYMDSLQRYRYHKYYLGYSMCEALYYTVAIILQFTGVKSIRSNLPGVLIELGILVVIMIYSTVRDFKEKHAQKYKLVLCGMTLLVISGFVQLISSEVLGKVNCTHMCLGFAGLTLCVFIHGIIRVMAMAEERKQALLTADVKSQFLATMSHEIRTPINAVLGMNEAILRESTEENILSYATDVDGAGKLLLSLINDILDFSKLDSGKMDIVPVEYDLKSVTCNTYNLVGKRATDKGLKLNFEVDPRLPRKLLGDEIRIQQIITNLLTNAIKYTPRGSVKMSISGESIDLENMNLIIKVADTGIGIQEEDKNKLFDTFSRLEHQKNLAIEGTGLGLTITKRLVDLMDGSISVESEYGNGSEFTVVLQQKIVDAEPLGIFSYDSSEKHVIAKASKDLFESNDATILVVDDVAVNLRVVKSLLKKTGIKIDTAASGRECLDMVQKERYDVIFLDHMMPEMNGIETIHEILEMKDHKNVGVPIVALTANAVPNAREMYLAEGFSDYLSKPFSLNEIQKVLLKYLPEDKVAVKQNTDK